MTININALDLAKVSVDAQDKYNANQITGAQHHVALAGTMTAFNFLVLSRALIEAHKALVFYQDETRYTGANRLLSKDERDPYTPEDAFNRMDVFRDNGRIARVAIAKITS